MEPGVSYTVVASFWSPIRPCELSFGVSRTIFEFRSPIAVLRLDDKQPAFSIAASAGAPRLQLPARRSDKGSDQCGDLICSSVQCEMTRVENVNFSVRYILAIALRFAGIEREVILAPDHQQARLLGAHPCLPLRIGVHIGSIVVKQVALNLGLAGLVEKIEFICPEIRVVAFHVRIVSDMARARGRERQEIRAQRAFVGRAIGPKGSPRLPIRPQTFVVPDSILDDERLDALRMSQGHAKTDRAAVILHVNGAAREPERFGKVIHDLRIVIKRIRELLRVWPVAMSEAGVIGRDQVIAIGKPGEEDRKSTRLNSSHITISYAVFCLK